MSDEIVTQFQPLIEAFVRANVRFVVIGGVAMRLQGSAHITDDFNIVYDRRCDNLPTVIAALAPHHPTPRGAPEGLPFFWDVRTLSHGANFTLKTDLGSVDILGLADGAEDFEALWNRATLTELDGISVRVASVDDLIAMKRAANRPKDQNHILELLALKKILEEDAVDAETSP